MKDVKILKFYTKWCIPCETIAPLVEEISKDLGISVENIDLEKEEKKAEEYNVTSVPTLVILKNNKEIGRICGSYSKERLFQKIKEIVL